MQYALSRLRLLASLAALFLLVSLFMPVAPVSADGGPEPGGNKVEIPKPKGSQPPPPIGQIRDDGKKSDSTQSPGSPDAITSAAWSVSLSTSAYLVNVNQSYTITAIANQDVGPTPYYILIFWNGTLQARCAIGTTCSIVRSHSTGGTSYTYQARIADYYGNTLQALSNTATVSVRSSNPWAITLGTTLTIANVGQTWRLTARTNQDVGPTPYYIQIYWGNLRYASCGVGTSCSTNLLFGRRAGVNYTFYARVANSDGSGIQALSTGVTIRIVAPSSVRLSVPFLTQIGTAGVAGSGSNNCGPASVAMGINFFGNSVTVADAAVAIRGYNNSTNGTTDFKSAKSTEYLAKYNLRPISIATYSEVQSELALLHPVIILVNNYQYRYQSPRPYESDSSGWFTTAHIVVVTGYDATNVYVNDPLRRTSSTLTNPANYAIPIATFKSAASTTPSTTSSSWYAIAVSR